MELNAKSVKCFPESVNPWWMYFGVGLWACIMCMGTYVEMFWSAEPVGTDLVRVKTILVCKNEKFQNTPRILGGLLGKIRFERTAASQVRMHGCAQKFSIRDKNIFIDFICYQLARLHGDGWEQAPRVKGCDWHIKLHCFAVLIQISVQEPLRTSQLLCALCWQRY